MPHARGVETDSLMLEINALPKILYAISAQQRHFAKVCKSKVVSAVEQQGEDSDTSEVCSQTVSAPKKVD